MSLNDIRVKMETNASGGTKTGHEVTKEEAAEE